MYILRSDSFESAKSGHYILAAVTASEPHKLFPLQYLYHDTLACTANHAYGARYDFNISTTTTSPNFQLVSTVSSLARLQSLGEHHFEEAAPQLSRCPFLQRATMESKSDFNKKLHLPRRKTYSLQ
jgi:hypothetical protein